MAVTDNPVRHLSITILLVVFRVETVIMGSLLYFGIHDDAIMTVVDPLLLSAILVPVLHFKMVAPFERTIRRLTEREQELEDVKLGLETHLDGLSKQLDEIVHNVADGIMIVSKDDNIIRFVNPTAARLFGRRPDAIVGMPFGYAGVAGGSFEIDLLAPTGDSLCAELRVAPITWDHEAASLMSLRDITERKRDEDRLHTLSRIVEQNPAAIVVTDLNGVITYVNTAFQRITGYSPAKAVGARTSILQSGNTPPEVYQDQWRTILAGSVWTGEIQNRRPDGTLYWTELIVTPILSSDGAIETFAGISTDITERRQTAQHLIQAQKMEIVGNLTGGIAHDFNNILGIALGNLQLLQRRVKDDERLVGLTETAVEAIQRGADLTKRLLAFSRRQELEPKLLDIDELIEGMMKLLGRTLGEDIEIETKLAGNLDPILADPTQLESAILNLSINARDAMPGGGKLLIETTGVDLDAAYVEQYPYAKTGPHVCVFVSDTGVGIPNELLDKIYQPFFTTKDVGKGTGLGLSMVFGFVKQSGGHIHVYSEEGHGTRFRIYLPSTDSSDAARPGLEPAGEELPTGAETVLLVEDDEAFRRTATLLLKELGYTVIEAANGGDGLAMLVAHPEVDLLFTDLIMPGGMNGQELAEKARELRPGLPVLLTTGYSRDTFAEGRKFPLLGKPYTDADLSRAVRRALDEPKNGET